MPLPEDNGKSTSWKEDNLVEERSVLITAWTVAAHQTEYPRGSRHCYTGSKYCEIINKHNKHPFALDYL